MIKNKLIFGFVTVTILCLSLGVGTTALTKEDGAPSGNTGSPDDDATCAKVGCHTGSAISAEGILSSNVPVTGYLSTETYTISVTVESAGRSTFGFQASPQTIDGEEQGEIIVTDEVQTKLVGFGKYITHQKEGLAGSDGKTWSFDWTPTSSTGDVTFYVAVNAADGDEEATGDFIFTSSLTITENSSNNPLSIEEVIAGNRIVVNNPVQNSLLLNIVQFKNLHTIEVFSLSGQLLSQKEISQDEKQASISTQNLESGIYIVKIKGDQQSYTSKFVKL